MRLWQIFGASPAGARLGPFGSSPHGWQVLLGHADAIPHAVQRSVGMHVNVQPVCQFSITSAHQQRASALLQRLRLSMFSGPQTHPALIPCVQFLELELVL